MPAGRLAHLALGLLPATTVWAPNPPASGNADDTPNAVPTSSGATSTGEHVVREEDRRYIFSVRGTVGFGEGGLGPAYHLGGATEYFFGDAVGVGLGGGIVGQWSGGLLDSGTTSSATFIVPALALRSAPREGYFIGTLGVGYASVERAHSPGLCINFGGGECPPSPDRVVRYGGYALGAAVGFLVHPGGSLPEIGAVGRLIAVGDFRGNAPVDYLFTINLEAGLAWLGR